MKTIVILFAALLLLSGCAVGVAGPEFSRATQPDPNSAIVYIYREPGFAFAARPAYFYVDGTNVFDLSPEGYSWVALSPGKYKIKQAWPIDVPARSIELDLTVRAGESHFFAFSTGGCTGNYVNVCVSWELREQPEQIALSSIQKKRMQENFGAAKLAEALKRR